MFLSFEEQELMDDFLENGYVIRKSDASATERIRASICHIIRDYLGERDTGENPDDLLNNIHEKIPVSELNSFRLKVIQKMNALPQLRRDYFLAAKSYLDTLVGNELAMQLRVNLSIQYPGDSSSLLPVHSDTWSGDSPFEIVVWIPLVDCYRTKSMYILPPGPSGALIKDFSRQAGKSSEDLFHSISADVKFLEMKYGDVLLFDQGLPHGNRINLERHTRWSMNCRFKGVFTPYGDKKIGEFFEPITLRAASRLGMNYKFPRVSHEGN